MEQDPQSTSEEPAQELANLGQCPRCVQVQELQGVADKYAGTVEENRRLYNEVQDLKGNIRVFCRIRPLGKTGDHSAGQQLSACTMHVWEVQYAANARLRRLLALLQTGRMSTDSVLSPDP